MTHVLPDGTRELVGAGYSGFGSALDEPVDQNLGNVGPIPRGAWIIGPQQNHPLAYHRGTLWGAMKLTPGPGNHTASKGCIVLPESVRNAIARSGDPRLEVVHP